MKKLLISSSITALLLPVVAFAAYNSVSLDDTTNISVNSITVDVAGSDATIESIEVDSTQFTAVLQSGSYFKVSPSERNQLSYDILYAGNQAPSVEYVCTSATSTLLVTSVQASSTLIVTPSSSLCTTAADPVAGSSRNSERSGGGGGSPTVPVVTAETQEINTLMAQIASLRAQIAALGGVATPASVVTPGVVTGKITLTTNLSKGSRGASVKSLQQFLNTHGFVIASSGPGSPGNETDMLGSLTVQAVQKFQAQYNIATQGVPGYGTVGPKTRAKINEISAQ